MELTLQEKLKLINFFKFLLDEEISKPLGEMNSVAVDNYIKILLTLQNKKAELSSEFINEQVSKIFHTEENAAPETAKTTKKRYSKNKIWLVAACITILVALFSVLSFSSERSVVNVLEDFFGTFELIPFGEKIDIGNESYGKGNSNSKVYTSIEELVNNKKIDLLYPGNIEDKIDLISVGETTGKESIDISYVDSELFIYVELNSELSKEAITYYDKKIIIDGINYYIFIKDDVPRVQAYFIYKGNLYVVTHTDENSLMEILNDMEETKYEN